jgi:hypothetical protein
MEGCVIGKLVRALIGRSIAKRHGYSGTAGAVAGLLAPTIIKRGGSLLARGGAAAREGRRRRRGPKYMRRIS